VTLALGAELLTLSGLASDVASARAALERALASGAAAERFERMVALLGGPKAFLSEARAALPAAPVVVAAAPKREGFVERIDVRAVGMAVVELGGGRTRASDRIDPAVGFTRLAGLGAEVSRSTPLALVHARDEARAFVATESLRAAYQIADALPAASDPVVARIAEGSP
jgi:thymidine phosphorylase